MTNNTDIAPKAIFSSEDFPSLDESSSIDSNSYKGGGENYSIKILKKAAPKRKNSNIIIVGQKSFKNLNGISVRNNTKTRFCKSIDKNTGDIIHLCNYGDNCKFAHSWKELRINNCRFGDKCNKIKLENNIIINNHQDNICHYIHPGEDNQKFSYRTNILKPQLDSENTKSFLTKNDYNPYRYPNQIYLKVPRQLASLALQKSLDEGKTDIRLKLL